MNDTIARPWHIDDNGLIVIVRLTPRGGRDSIDGAALMADGRCALHARVRPPPEDGAANTALMKLLAKTASIPISAVKIISGQTSRIKTMHLSGDSSRIEAALSASILKSGKNKGR